MKDIRGPTMAQAGFHHANHLATEIRKELSDNQSQMLAVLREFSDNNAENGIEEEQVQAANLMSQFTIQNEII